MTRRGFLLTTGLLTCALAGCGGGASNNDSGGGSGGGGVAPGVVPQLSSIVPSGATVGTSGINLVVNGAQFQPGATVEWNGSALASVWMSGTEMTATVPASDVASVGRANVTIANPGPSGGTSGRLTFTIYPAPAASVWVRTVPGITAPQDIVWDATHQSLYVSVSSSDPVAPNSVVAISPLTGTAGTSVQAGNNPHLLSISSDSSYLWVGLDGDNSVQRILLPGLTKDISFQLPLFSGTPQQAVSLQAAPVSPHTVGLVAGNWTNSPPGEGVYVYDDASQRGTSVSGFSASGPEIDWIQWGASDSTIYGNEYDIPNPKGTATLSVNSSGVTFQSYNGANVGPVVGAQYDSGTGLIYSRWNAFNPVNGSLVATLNLPSPGESACTADSSAGRYYCFVQYSDGGTDVSLFELWVFDLKAYGLLNRVYFGVSSGTPLSQITGQPAKLVRWGNAGLALITTTAPYEGSGGVFLLDGVAINPGSPDTSSGTPVNSYSWLTSITPQSAVSGSGDVAVTINGNNFTPDSTACWNCTYSQVRNLATTYVNPQQLNTTIPANLVGSPGPIPINVYDTNSNLFSTDALTFTVGPTSSGSTQVTPINLSGLAMAWDAASQFLYVGTADYDGEYPNSIVAINPASGAVVSSQSVGDDPDLLSVGATGEYIYAAFAGATTMTQVQLPGLGSPLTWPLNNPSSSAVYWAGDMRAAPVSPHTTAAALLNFGLQPDETGGVVIYDDNVERPNFAPGWGDGDIPNAMYDTLAWSSSDQVLASACSAGCLSLEPLGQLYELQVTQSGAAFVAGGTAPFNSSSGEIHSDFGTGLIYSDDGNVADPTTQAIVGTYNASGLVAPDSSLNRTFILGQTSGQYNTSNFTIQSFDEKAYAPVSSITLNNLLGTPIQLVRCGTSGLALLTLTQAGGSQGMLYLIQDSTFVSGARKSEFRASGPWERVQRRWKPVSRADIVKRVQRREFVGRP